MDANNPYKPVPLPIPLPGTNLTAPEIFTFEILSERIRINRGWLAAQPRTTRQIIDAFFPHFEMGGITRTEVLLQLNAAMWEAGFRVDEVKENPVWSLPKEADSPQDDLGDLWKVDATKDFQA